MLQRAFVVQAIGIAAVLVLSSCGAHLTSGLDLTNAPAPEPKAAPPACSMDDLSGCETGAAVTL